MPVLPSRVESNSITFARNRADMLALIGNFRALEQAVHDLSNSKKAKFEKRGQLVPRERMSLLLDRGAPCLEFSTLAGYQLHDDNGKEDILGGCVITGIGYV